MPRARLEIALTDGTEVYGKITVDSSGGPEVSVEGKLYPADVKFMLKILEMIGEFRDRYPPTIKGRGRAET